MGTGSPQLQHFEQPTTTIEPINQPLSSIIMSTDMIRMDGVYCALCDEYFFDKRQRAEHIMNSNDHPECWRCGRRFLNGQILRRVS